MPPCSTRPSTRVVSGAAWGQTWQRHAGFAPEQILLQVHSVNAAQGGQVPRKSLQFVAT